ncbi:hypothetical protein pb186bvf_018586 [Paramecium bursaria]
MQILLVFLIGLTIGQEEIYCSGYLKWPKGVDQNYESIQIVLLEGQKIQSSADIADNGFYRILIPSKANYDLSVKIANPRIQATPSQLTLNFASKTQDQVQQICQKQNNFQLKLLDEAVILQKEDAQETPKKNEQVQLHVPEIFRIRGQLLFEGNFTDEDIQQYNVKTIQLLDQADEPIKDVRTLAFKRYFEASILYRADVKLKITVQRDKQRGEQQPKVYEFQQDIASHQIHNQIITFKIQNEFQQKNNNKVGQVLAPLLIFIVVILIVNFDKLQKKKK